MKKSLRNFFGLLYGIIYGVAHIVPGLSGGTFLVIFGCYDLVCQAFALNFKEIKKHFLFLALFGVGTVGGLVGFAHIITYLFANFPVQTSLFFMGLILGGIPLIAKTATGQEDFKPACLLPFVLGFALVTSLFLLEKFGIFHVDAAGAVDLAFTARIVLYAFIAAIAMVMPGISGAFVLVAFGVYDLFMQALRVFDLAVIIPAAIGVLAGIVVGAKLILLLLSKFQLMIYSAILGMVVGSMVPLFPSGVGLNAATLSGIFCLALGGLSAAAMGKKEYASK